MFLFGLIVFGHSVFFIVSLAFIGFWPMISDLILALWAYAVYLTVREWAVVLYCVMCVGFTINNLLATKSDKNIIHTADAKQTMAKLVLQVFHVCAVYFVVLRYWDFRRTGGIFGRKGKAACLAGSSSEESSSDDGKKETKNEDEKA